MRLKELLKEKDITMYKLAKESGLGQCTVNEICNGKRKHIQLMTAAKMSKVLDITVDELNCYLEGNRGEVETRSEKWEN